MKEPTKPHTPFAARGEGWILERKTALRSTATLRDAILSLAQQSVQEPGVDVVLQLVRPAISDETLRHQWGTALAALRDEVAARMCLLVERAPEGWSAGNPLNDRIREEIRESTVDDVRRAPDRAPRRDLDAQIVLVLLERLLRGMEPARIEWIRETVGCSYPTVNKALERLRPYLLRTSSRSAGLMRFPYPEWHLLALRSERIRSTHAYADRSGKPRSASALLERLRRMDRPDIGIGGAEGARHYDPRLNLIGLPRLDVSLHCPDEWPDVEFVRQLDPGLKPVADATEPASLVVHLVRRSDPLFEKDAEGRVWAGPAECLWDLGEMRLDDQATWFISRLVTDRGAAHE